MATLYDIRITTQGFFTLLGHHVHTPANIYNLESGEIELIEQAGWLFDVLATHDEIPAVDSIYASDMRMFNCETEADIEKIKGIRNNDWVLVLETGKIYVYNEDV